MKRMLLSRLCRLQMHNLMRLLNWTRSKSKTKKIVYFPSRNRIHWNLLNDFFILFLLSYIFMSSFAFTWLGAFSTISFSRPALMLNEIRNENIYEFLILVLLFCFRSHSRAHRRVRLRTMQTMKQFEQMKSIYFGFRLLRANIWAFFDLENNENSFSNTFHNTICSEKFVASVCTISLTKYLIHSTLFSIFENPSTKMTFRKRIRAHEILL